MAWLVGALLVASSGCGGGDSASPADVPQATDAVAPAEDQPMAAATQTSPEELLTSYYELATAGEFDPMFELLDPAARDGVAKSDWVSCIGGRFEALPDDATFVYHHSSTGEIGDRTHIRGYVDVTYGGSTVGQPQESIVIERDGQWFVVGSVDASRPDCLQEVSGS